ncbi:hypothetical protein [Peribacillus asahii]|uniref:hypothetical protein n=1 Tax=Peribacillus asahii TaxID=228899 RepID=UPI003816F089
MKRVVVAFIFIVLVYFAGSWLYPYSIISLNKSYSYNQDNVSGKQFLEKYKEAKRFLANQEKDVVSTRVLYFYEDINQTYIVHLGEQSISKDDLQSLQSIVTEHKQNFLQLFTFTDVQLSEHTSYYVINIINKLDEINSQLHDLEHSNFYTRQEIRRSVRNILVNMMFVTEHVDVFYQSYVNEKVD